MKLRFLCLAALSLFAFGAAAQMSHPSGSMGGMQGGMPAEQNDTSAYNPGGAGVKQFVPPIFRGMSAHLDIASPLMGFIRGGDIYNFEAQVDVNLYDRLFPIVEVGYTSVNGKVGAASYRTNAPFFKVGINYGLLKGFKNDGTPRSLRSYPFIGVRYAFSPMNYSLRGVSVTDDYWGGSGTRDYGAPLVYVGWLEIVGGVRVNLAHGFTMGWSARMQLALHSSKNVVRSALWYVPGYASANNTSQFSFNYTVGYTFNTSYFEKKEEIGL